MKQFILQSMTVICTLGIALQSPAEPRLCSSALLSDSSHSERSALENLILPRRVRDFDSDLYWKVLSGEKSVQSLSKKDLKTLEVKLALIDAALPEGSIPWAARLPELSVFRIREINSLLNTYQLKDFKDDYLRDKFVTQLYVLSHTPWSGLVKSVTLAQDEAVQSWARRNLEQQLLSQGLRSVVGAINPGDRAWLEQALLYYKKIKTSGLLGLPTRLPMFNKDLDSSVAEDVLWNGVDATTLKRIRSDHGLDIYNQFSRNYNRVAITILIGSLYYLIPQMQKQFEEEVHKRIVEHANDPENVKKRDEAFEKSMAQLDAMNKQLDAYNNQDPKEEAFQETLEMFESLNHRKATVAEVASLRQKMGLQ